MINQRILDWLLLKPITGHRTYLFVWIAFWLNFACFFDLPEANRNLLKLLVQQALILCIGTMGSKLDRLRK